MNLNRELPPIGMPGRPDPDPQAVIRRIVDPEFGVKVTARSTKWAIAGLSANDRAVAAEDADGVFGRTAKVGAARIERNFGDRSKLAVLSTERQVGRGSNAVVSVDGRTNLSALWTISGQAVRSDDVDQSGGRVNGAAYFTGIARNEDNFTLQLQTLDGTFHFFQKAELEHLEYQPSSIMPADYGTKLSGAELDDLISYLVHVARAKSAEKSPVHQDDDYEDEF